jgi:hypothetical protein
MTDRPREIRNAAEARNAVSAQPAFALARGCSGRFAADNKMLTIGFEGGSVVVEILTMIAKTVQRTAMTVDSGASHGGGKRYTEAIPATTATAAATAERFTSRRLTFDMSGDRRHTKCAVGRPLDGGVRLHVVPTT